MSDRLEQGRALLRATIGDDYYEQRRASTNAFNAKLRGLTDEYCFGEVWADPTVPPKWRSLIVVALLAAGGRVPELRTHIGGALNNGCTPEELREVLLQVAVYCGIPVGVEGFRSAEAVLRERGLLGEPAGAA
ncbi:MAG: carboxymuconolactone decarboxylase family protein [Lysobacterales bacterium]